MLRKFRTILVSARVFPAFSPPADRRHGRTDIGNDDHVARAPPGLCRHVDDEIRALHRGLKNRALARGCQRVTDCAPIAADETRRTVDDRLRRIDR